MEIFKDCFRYENVLKYHYDTRWEALAMATAAILRSFLQSLEGFKCLEDQSLKGDARRKTENIANKM